MKRIQGLAPVVAALLLVSCGGEETPSVEASAVKTGSGGQAGTSAQASPCPSSVATNQNFACELASSAANTEWQLIGAPEGMVIQAESGTIHWTPLSNQRGNTSFTARAISDGTAVDTTIRVNVKSGNNDAPGIYVSPNGDDSASGNATAPLRTIQAAVDAVQPGQTIYIRGGEYRNAEFGQPYAGRQEASLVQITTGGTASQPITMQPHGDEYVTLRSDVNGIRFSNDATDHWTIRGLRLVGNAQQLSEDIALANWWSDEPILPMQGRGIGGQMDHVTIEDTIVQDFPGAGIAPRRSEYVTIRNNMVFNNAWWSTAGTHGITVSNMKPSAQSTNQTVVIEGNVVWGNQSLVISHVFSKGKVTLVLDEGNGIHLQNNQETFGNEALVQNNLVMWNGKAGLGINTMNRATISNNSFFQNARVVERNGELSNQSSILRDVSNNLFHPRLDRRTILDSADSFANVGTNATLAGVSGDTLLPTSVMRLSAVFANPGALDFSPSASASTSMGVASGVLTSMFEKLREYGINPIQPNQPYEDNPYLLNQKARIMATWPARYGHLLLEDKALGYTYTYAQRCYYPQVPASSDCP